MRKIQLIEEQKIIKIHLVAYKKLYYKEVQYLSSNRDISDTDTLQTIILIMKDSNVNATHLSKVKN